MRPGQGDKGTPSAHRGCGPAPSRRLAGARSAAGPTTWRVGGLVLWTLGPLPADFPSPGELLLCAGHWFQQRGATRELATPWERWTMTAQTHSREASGWGPTRHVAGRRPWFPFRVLKESPFKTHSRGFPDDPWVKNRLPVQETRV